jgi:hypothetical protein
VPDYTRTRLPHMESARKQRLLRRDLGLSSWIRGSPSSGGSSKRPYIMEGVSQSPSKVKDCGPIHSKFPIL